MTLQQMEYIVALDKYRHFVLAAEACGEERSTFCCAAFVIRLT